MTLRELLASIGFKGSSLDTAAAVAMAESGGNAAAHNTTGLDDSYSIFQINMKGTLGPDRRARYGLANDAALLDPATNARVAYSMSNGGTNWSAWSTYVSGAYRKFLGKDVEITNTAGTSRGSPGATTAQNVGLVKTPAEVGAMIVKVVIVGIATAGGVGLLWLGANKATGWPGVKAAKLTADVAL